MSKSKITNYYISKSSELEFLFAEDSKAQRKKDVIKPFSKSVRTKKDTTTYNAHSYPTKVPPEGIIQFIDHFTSPGDIVLDPFCGSGMTGLATKMFVNQANEDRTVILNDLGTAATHIAFNYNNSADPEEFRNEYTKIFTKLEAFKNEIYRTFHPLDPSSNWQNISLKQLESAEPSEDGVISVRNSGAKVQFVKAEIVTMIWSEVNLCTKCEAKINLWHQAMNPKTGKMAKSFKCPDCKTEHSRSDFDKPHSQEPAFIIYEYTCSKSGKNKRFEREAARYDFEYVERLNKKRIDHWVPDHEIAPTREMMTMGPAKLGVKKVSDFYTRRNLIVCSKIWSEIEAVANKRIRAALMFGATNTFWHATKMRRFNVKGGMRPLTGTLYIPQISAEVNVFNVLEKKYKELTEFYRNPIFTNSKLTARHESYQLNESATNLVSIPDGSIDYIFTDPPFGGNIYYSDCNVIFEGWLDKLTDDTNEILFNRSRKPKDGGKTRNEYHSLMDAAFKEMYRVLKAGKWASVVFNNSDNDILAGFVDSANKAGFEVKEVTFFDKDQKSVKGYMGQKGVQNVTNLDIVLTVQKPINAKKRAATERRKSISDEKIFKVVKNYLLDLPKMVQSKNSVYTEEHRSSPFLHSMLLRYFIKNNIDLNELTIDRLHQICSSNGMTYADGRWFISDITDMAA